MSGGIESYEVPAEAAPDLTGAERGELTRFMRMVGRAAGDTVWVPDPRWRFDVFRDIGWLRVTLLDSRGHSQGTYIRVSSGSWWNAENDFRGRP